ncbi:MAG: thiosulfate oxidation carrier protein SoxY [Geminicoccaceae bacterium]
MSSDGDDGEGFGRREVLRAAALAGWLLPRGAKADEVAPPDVARLLAGRTPGAERIRIDLQAAVEDGSSVPITLEAPSAMEAADRVVWLQLVAPANPEPVILRCTFTALSGRARVATRIRLAGSQTVWAVGETGKGDVFLGSAPVTVSVGGCG